MKKKIISGLCAGAMLIGMIEAPINDIQRIFPMELVASAANSNTISLSGYVWRDVPLGKNFKERNGLFDITADECLSAIDVQLINNKTKTTQHTYTDSTGHYIFSNVLVSNLSNYSIKIEYNGLEYETITDNTVGSNNDFSSSYIDQMSKSTEDVERRNALNQLGLNITSGKKADSTYSISASINGSYISDYYSFLSGNGKTTINEINYLNLGLYRRTEPMVGLSYDTYTAEIVDDGEEYTFYYDSRNTPDSAVDNDLPYGVAFKRKNAISEDLTYKNPFYKREVSTVVDKNLSEAYITYKIGFVNNSAFLLAAFNSINVFYPSTVELTEVYSKTDDGVNKKVNYSLESFTNTSSNSTLNNYICKRIIFNTPINTQKQRCKYVYIRYRIKNPLADIINKELDVDTYSEINSYSVYSDDDFTMPYLGYDYYSTPNNFISGNIEADSGGASSFKLLLRTELHGDSNTHTYTSSIKKQPTCTESGIRKYKCKCGYSYTEDIPKLGHSYTTKVIAPTSTEKGYTLHTCTRCAYSYKDNYVDALGIDISKCTVTLGTSTYTYDGTAKKPSVTVKNGSTVLTNGTDYTVSYSSNTNAGTAKATITGKGNYTGTASKTFTINAKSVSGMTVTLSQSSYTYDGNAKKPTVTVKDGTKTLVNGTDYSVTYSNNVNVGTAKTTVTGKGNYQGSKTVSYNIIQSNTNFRWGYDNWRFNNSSSNFGKTYYMNTTYYNRLINGLNRLERISVTNGIKGTWKGSCYGMAITSILGNKGILLPSQYKNGAKYVSEISGPPSSDVKSLINYYFAIQYTDKMQQLTSNALYESEETKIKKLINCLEDGSPTLFTYFGPPTYNPISNKYSYSGHAVVAYDVKNESSTTSDGFKYNKIVLIYDNRFTGFNKSSCLYINTNNWTWYIPYDSLGSTSGAIIGLTTDSIDDINYHGFIDGSSIKSIGSFISVLSLNSVSSEIKWSKFDLTDDGINYNSLSTDEMIFFSPIIDSITNECMNVGFKDSHSGYTMKLSSNEKQNISMRYENSLININTSNSNTISFAPNGFAMIQGKDTDYDIDFIYNDGYYYTDWYSVGFTGNTKDWVSVNASDKGFIIKSSDLNGIIIKAQNDDNNASITLSTNYKEALIYEIDPNTIGVKVDTDNNGTYETAINGGSETKAISKLSISLSSSSYVYDGSAKKPAVTVKDGSKALVNGTDYTVAYSNNTAAGTAKVTITGKGKYTGSVTNTFTITRASLAKAKISGLSNKTYTGKAITQNPTVKLGSKTLKKGTDYTVTFKNNKAVGKATVTIKGKGNYTGSISKTFKINPKKTTLKSAASPKTKQLKVTYSKVSGVTGYQTVYSTSSKFTKATTKTASSKSTSKTISGLTKGKTYYVKVRTYKTVNGTKYYSEYSSVKKVKIK